MWLTHWTPATDSIYRRHIMQQSFGIKQFVGTHIVATALAVGVMVSAGTGVAGLAATNTLPWQQAAHVVTASAGASHSTAAAIELRQLTMDRADYFAWRNANSA